MRILSILALIVASLVSGPAMAWTCVAWAPPYPIGNGQCMQWVADPPAGWATCANQYAPAAGEAKICTGTGGGGTCAKRSCAAGASCTVTSLGDYVNFQSYWFNVARDSTRYSNANLACPTCTTIPAGSNYHNGPLSATQALVIRN